jgi:hypothetical protein
MVRRDEAADEVRAAGGEHVLVSGPDLAADIASELDGEQLSLVLDGLGPTPRRRWSARCASGAPS